VRKTLRENESKRRQTLAWGRRSGRREEEERPQKRARAERARRSVLVFVFIRVCVY
jgi:hypothetical protein